MKQPWVYMCSPSYVLISAHLPRALRLPFPPSISQEVMGSCHPFPHPTALSGNNPKEVQILPHCIQGLISL